MQHGPAGPNDQSLIPSHQEISKQFVQDWASEFFKNLFDLDNEWYELKNNHQISEAEKTTLLDEKQTMLKNYYHTSLDYLVNIMNVTPTFNHLSIENITVAGLGALSLLLAQTHHLKHLELRALYSPDHFHVLVEGLRGNRTLESFSIDNLAVFNNKLTILDILDKEHCHDLLGALTENKKLRFLHIQGLRIRNSGMKVIADEVKHNSNLERLELYFNGIFKGGLVHLLKAMKFNQHLKSMLIKEGQLRTSIQSDLINMLNTNQSVRKIKLPNFAQSDEEVKELDTALEQNQSLIAFNLWTHEPSKSIPVNQEPFRRNQLIFISQIGKRFSSLVFQLEDYGNHELSKHLSYDDSLNLSKVNYELYYGYKRKAEPCLAIEEAKKPQRDNIDEVQNSKVVKKLNP